MHLLLKTKPVHDPYDDDLRHEIPDHWTMYLRQKGPVKPHGVGTMKK